MRDPFNRPQRTPGDYSREGRVGLIGSFSAKVQRGEWPTAEEIGFVCGGIDAWLNGRARLLHDAWRVVGRQGDPRTPAMLWATQLLQACQRDAERPE